MAVLPIHGPLVPPERRACQEVRFLFGSHKLWSQRVSYPLRYLHDTRLYRAQARGQDGRPRSQGSNSGERLEVGAGLAGTNHSIVKLFVFQDLQ